MAMTMTCLTADHSGDRLVRHANAGTGVVDVDRMQVAWDRLMYSCMARQKKTIQYRWLDCRRVGVSLSVVVTVGSHHR